MRYQSFAVLLVLLCAAGCLAATMGDTAAQHRCMFDTLRVDPAEAEVALVRELPTSAEAPAQTYSAVAPDWEPLRIRIFTEDIRDESRHCTETGQKRPDFMGSRVPCRAHDILTDAKKAVLVDTLLAEGAKLHAERLLVRRLRAPLLVPPFPRRSVCNHFTVPADHRTAGVRGADMVLYAAAGPIATTAFAWSVPCAVAANDRRPVVGAINYAPQFIAAAPDRVRVAAHEMAHALGFSFAQMKERDMLTVIRGARGKAEITVLSAPKTTEKARAHYQCDALKGMELEDENEAASGTVPRSHWKRRNAKDELMAAITGAGRYTAMTMAALEDLGYFRANFSMAERMDWGAASGCALHERKCMENGVTDYPDMFCTPPSAEETDALFCTSERHALGSCGVKRYITPFSKEYRYFADKRIGGYRDAFTDYCPVITPRAGRSCLNGDVSLMPGSVVGPNSMCLKGESLSLDGKIVGDVCAEVRCDDGIVMVRHFGDNAWLTCPEGSVIVPTCGFSLGTITCPRRRDVCSQDPSPESSSSDLSESSNSMDYSSDSNDSDSSEDSSDSDSSSNSSDEVSESSSDNAVYKLSLMSAIVLFTVAVTASA